MIVSKQSIALMLRWLRSSVLLNALRRNNAPKAVVLEGVKLELALVEARTHELRE